MGNTRYSSLVHSLGVPTVGGGLPVTGGKVIFLDAAFGSDGNSGETPSKAVRSLAQAYAIARDGMGDIIYMLSRGGSSTANYTQYLTSTFTWAKNQTHLIGAAAPSGISPRARIAVASSVTTSIDPLFLVSGVGCIFANFQIFSSVGTTGTDANGLEVTGARNYFYKVHAAGMGEAANGYNDRANGFSLNVNGGDENLFEECVIGIETTAKGSAANSEIRFESAAERNTFLNCKVMTFAEASGHQYVLVPASGIEGTQVFENCLFTNKIQGGSTAMTEAFSVNATQNGAFYLINCFTDAGDWEASPTDHVRTLGAVTDQGILASVS